jgi:hypothetical protein
MFVASVCLVRLAKAGRIVDRVELFERVRRGSLLPKRHGYGFRRSGVWQFVAWVCSDSNWEGKAGMLPVGLVFVLLPVSV